MKRKVKKPSKKENKIFNGKKHSNLDYKPFTCPKCNYPYKFLRNLKEHFKSFHLKDNFSCQICHETVKGDNEFRKHLRNHSTETMQCEYCDQILDKIPIDFHLAQCKRRPLFDYEKITIVSSGDETKQNYKPDGMFKCISNNSEICNLCWIPSDSSVFCSKCFVKFSSNIQLKNHKCGPTIKHPNYDSSQKNPISQVYTKKTKIVENRFSSPLLLVKFINSQCPDSKDKSTCSLCQNNIPQSKVISHLLKNHQMTRENIVCTFTSLNKKFQRKVICNWCDREFHKSQYCTNHSRSCHKRPKYEDDKCNHCKAKFESSKKFQIHDCFRNYKLESAQCKTCKILFNDLLTFDFKSHEVNCPNIPLIPPPVRKECCPVPVSQNIVESEKTLLCCYICEQLFPTQAILASHSREHIENITFNDKSMDSKGHEEKSGISNSCEKMETGEIITSDCVPTPPNESSSYGASENESIF